MSGANFVSCGVLLLGLLVKMPDLARHRRDPFLLAISSVLALAALCFLLGAPLTVGFINRVSGVPNLAAPLTYATITAYSAASLVLMVCWRGGPTAARTARRWILGYAAVLAGIAASFALGDASAERRTDFDTYYATTPFIVEMIILYLVAHLTAVTVTAWRSLSWARHVHGLLRAGLLAIGIGAVVGAGYSTVKLAAVAARWCGRNWSALGTTLAPVCAALGAVLTATGITLPLAGHYLTSRRRYWRAYVRLGPLDREMREILTRQYLLSPRPFPPSAARLLTWRQSNVYNGLSYLEHFFDLGLFRRTYADQMHATGDSGWAEAAAWGAAITAAVSAEGSREPMPVTVAERRALPAHPELPALFLIADALAASHAASAGADVGHRSEIAESRHLKPRASPSTCAERSPRS